MSPLSIGDAFRGPEMGGVGGGGGCTVAAVYCKGRRGELNKTGTRVRVVRLCLAGQLIQLLTACLHYSSASAIIPGSASLDLAR